MKNNKSKKCMLDSRGFSLLEVLIGISVFMIGMLGVTALNISSLKSNTFSGNLSEATLIAATKIEELLTQDFDDPAASELFDLDDDGNCQSLPSCSSPVVNQDVDDDGQDDDDPGDAAADIDNRQNFGLDDIGCPSSPISADDADYCETAVGKNGIYTIYWNVAENEPISVAPQRTKRIKIIVEWFIKDEPRRISMEFTRAKEE